MSFLNNPDAGAEFAAKWNSKDLSNNPEQDSPHARLKRAIGTGDAVGKKVEQTAVESQFSDDTVKDGEIDVEEWFRQNKEKNKEYLKK